MRFRLVFLLALAGTPAIAHEYWIEPWRYQVAPDSRLVADLVNGQQFEGVKLPFLAQRFERFEILSGDTAVPVEGRAGDRPALMAAPGEEGLKIVVLDSVLSRVEYDSFDEFLSFAEHKDFADIPARHDARGLPMTGIGEAYSRNAKALIAVGDGAGEDRRTGQEAEIVALDNPYTDDLSDGMRVQLWYRDDVRPGAQVELFEKAADGTVEITYHHADDQGIATLPVRPGHSYMADAVVLREPDAALAEAEDVVWETLWADFTFAVPAE